MYEQYFPPGSRFPVRTITDETTDFGNWMFPDAHYDDYAELKKLYRIEPNKRLKKIKALVKKNLPLLREAGFTDSVDSMTDDLNDYIEYMCKHPPKSLWD